MHPDLYIRLYIQFGGEFGAIAQVYSLLTAIEFGIELS
jgi:hypothetical protein